MKLRLLAIAMALTASGSIAQNIRLANVISVEHVQHKEMTSVPRQICSVHTEPVYNTTPVYNTYRDTNSPAPIVGLILGAVVGYNSFGTAPGLGALLGGSVGYSIGDQVRTSHPYWTGQTVTTVTQYNRSYCKTNYESVEIIRTIGYRVTYEVDGILNTIVTATHPGPHVRLETRVIQ